MPTVSELIHSSMRLIGAIAAGETLETEELNDALVTLNQMLAIWSDENVTVFAIKKDTFALTGATSYTMGPSGVAGAVRPTQVVAARASSGAYGRALNIIDVQRWAAVKERGNGLNLPLKAYVDYSFPLATVWLWPAPAAGTKIELYTIVEYTNISDQQPPAQNFVPQRTTYTMPGTSGTFTIGPGGQVPSPRPSKCIAIAVSSGAFRHEVDIATAEEWATYLEPDGTPISLPLEMYVEYSFPAAVLNLWPATSSGSVDVHSLQQLTQFTALTDTVAFPPGYEMAIRYNLAIALLPEYPRSEVDPTLPQQAQNYKASIVQLNTQNNRLMQAPATDMAQAAQTR